MAVDSNPFPEVAEVHMVSVATKKSGHIPALSIKDLEKRQKENIERKKDKQVVEEEKNWFVCFRCGTEGEKSQAIMAQYFNKHKVDYGVRFNTMGGGDLQIYNGTKMIYDGEDPGIFGPPSPMYGPRDGPFMVRGEPVHPCLAGAEMARTMLALPPKPWKKHKPFSGFHQPYDNFPTPPVRPSPYMMQPLQPVQFRDHPRMVKPPVPQHYHWQGVMHPKFPNWRPMEMTRTQKRREQRKFHAFMSRMEHEGPEKMPKNLVWTREGNEEHDQGSSMPKVAEKSLLRQKLKEFKDILLSEEEEEGEMEVDAAKLPVDSTKEDGSDSSGDFGTKLAAIQFGTVPNLECNMVIALSKNFQPKPNQPGHLAGDVLDMAEPAVRVTLNTQSSAKSIRIEQSMDGEHVVLQKPEKELTSHLRPLYVQAHLNGCPVDKVLIDNGAVVNLLPTRMLRKIGRSLDDLIPTEMTVSNFAGGCSEAKGLLALPIQIGSRLMGATFFVVDTTCNYNLLLGRDWIHANGCVPSSLHQALIFLTATNQGLGGGMEIHWADSNPFKADCHNVEAVLYKDNLSPVCVKDEELVTKDMGISQSHFNHFMKEGFRQISQDMAKPYILTKRPVDKAVCKDIDDND